jgi:hypothetical protein
MDWEAVKPVLDATYRLLAEKDPIAGEAVITELGRPANDEETGRTLEALSKADYIKGQFHEETPVPDLIAATEKGLQETSGWPKPGAGGGGQVELLLRLLDERIESPDTPKAEKTRLRKARDSFAAVGHDITVGVLTAFISKQTGATGD